jgi:hypothetical protein
MSEQRRNGDGRDRSHTNDSFALIDLVAAVGRLTFVATSAFASVASVVALLVIGAMLIFGM